jgi:hypothetical protein
MLFACCIAGSCRAGPCASFICLRAAASAGGFVLTPGARAANDRDTEGGQPGAPLARHHAALAALAGDLFHYQQELFDRAQRARRAQQAQRGPGPAQGSQHQAPMPAAVVATAAEAGASPRSLLGRRPRPAAEGRSSGAASKEEEEEVQEEDGIDEALPKKRARPAAPISRLVDFCADRPGQWGPPLAALLRQHGPAALGGAVEGIGGGGDGGGVCYALQMLRSVAVRLWHLLGEATEDARAAAATVAQGSGAGATGSGGAASSGGTAAGLTSAKRWDQVVWLVRIARELALAWPAQLHPAEAGAAGAASCGGSGAAAALQRAALAAQAGEAGRLWQVVWEAAVGYAADGATAALPAGLHSAFGYAPALRRATLWLLHAQLSAQLLAADGSGAGSGARPLNRPALAARLRRLWQPPFGDAEGVLLAAIASGGPLGGAGRGSAGLQAALAAACIETLLHGGPGGGSALALAPPPAMMPRPPVLAALLALLRAPPALGGAPLHEMRCEAAAAAAAVAAAEGTSGGAPRINGGMLAARLLAQQDAWEAGLTLPNLLQSPRLAAEAAGAFASGCAVSAALAAASAGGADAGGAGGGVLGAGGPGAWDNAAHCDWWAPDAESALAERQLSALEPAEARLGRQLEAARAANLARRAFLAGRNAGCGSGDSEGPRSVAAWWEVAAGAAAQLADTLQDLARRILPRAPADALGAAEPAAAAAAAANAAAEGAEAASRYLLPLLQAATVAVALCSAAAARPPLEPAAAAPAAAALASVDGAASLDSMNVDGGGSEDGGSAGPSTPRSGAAGASALGRVMELLGPRLAGAAALALLRAGPAIAVGCGPAASGNRFVLARGVWHLRHSMEQAVSLYGPFRSDTVPPRHLTRHLFGCLLAAPGKQGLLPDPSAFYNAAPLLRQLEQLSFEVARLSRIDRNLVAELGVAVSEVAVLVEAAAGQAAEAAAAAAEAAAAAFMQACFEGRGLGRERRVHALLSA